MTDLNVLKMSASQFLDDIEACGYCINVEATGRIWVYTPMQFPFGNGGVAGTPAEVWQVAFSPLLHANRDEIRAEAVRRNAERAISRMPSRA